MDRHGYYKALGVSTNATTKEIKSAYKKLAMQYHTDSPAVSNILRSCTTEEEREKKKKEFEKKFSELSTAYTVLSNDEKRKRYDLGQDDVDFGFGEADMGSSVFNSFFSGFGRRRAPEPTNRMEKVQITLQEAFTGLKKKYKITRKLLCRKCDSFGFCNSMTCKKCKGSGIVVDIKSIGGMYMQSEKTCGNCSGKGLVSNGPRCDSCAGKGYTKESATVEVEIPKGVKDRHGIVFQGMGDEEKDVGVGNLVFVICIKKHPVYVRIGDHLYSKMLVPVESLLCGTPFKIQTIEDKTIFVNIPDAHNINVLEQLLLVPGYGMNTLSGKREDLFIHIAPKFPPRDQVKNMIDTLQNSPVVNTKEVVSAKFVKKEILENYIEEDENTHQDSRSQERGSSRCNPV